MPVTAPSRVARARAVFARLRTGVPGSAYAAMLMLIFASHLPADTHAAVIDLFASMAAALSNSDPAEFMRACDKNMPGYDKLRAQIGSLMTQTEISSSVEAVKDGGDDTKRTVDLDWYLQIRSLLEDGPIAVRRQVIHCELRKEGKRWKIVSLQPLEFFAPAKLDK